MHNFAAIACKSLVLALLAFLIGPAAAQQGGAVRQSYDVELLIFSNNAGGGSSEQWDLPVVAPTQATPLPDEDSGAAVSASIPVQAAFDSYPPLNAAKFKLTAAADTLRRSSNYQPLAHFGWTQPGYPRTEAHYLSIEPLVGADAGLNGRISVTRGRYLHLALDLSYQSAEGSQRFVLRQTRRMRSNERHYIDHPMFGVIALITPTTN